MNIKKIRMPVDISMTILSVILKGRLHMTIERFVSDDKIPEGDKTFIRR